MKVPTWNISEAISEEEDSYNPSLKSNTFGKGMIETTFYDDFSSNNNSNNNNSANNNHYTLFVNGTVQVPTFTATTMSHPNNMNQLKRKMTLDLDFASGGGLAGIDLSSPSGLSNKLSVIKRSKVIQGLQTPQRLEILQSPDLHMLKLASPELEKLIIANSQGQITTTPTPNQIFFPKNVTEEQEFYAKGFVEALEKMKQQENTGPTPPTNLNQHNHQIQPPSLASTIPISNVTLTAVNHNITDTNSSSSDSEDNSNSNSMMTDESSNYQSSSTTATTSSGQIYYTNYYNSSPATTTSTTLLPTSAVPPESVMPQPNIMIKEELQVPSHTASSVCSNSPPMSPIDMANQERFKLERKRQRNRVAASKCRRRKLERISKLEDKVKQLNCENSELLTVLAKLRETVEGLKQQVLEHCNAGCQISLLNTSISTSNF